MSQTVQPQRLTPPGHRGRVPTWVWAGAGGRLFAAYWGSLLVVDLTRGGPVGVATATLALLVAGCSHGRSTGTAVAVAGIAWCFLVGFVVHADGELGPQRPGDLALLALVATLVAAATRRHTRTHTRTRGAR